MSIAFGFGLMYHFPNFLITEEAPPPCDLMRLAGDDEVQYLSGAWPSPLAIEKAHEHIITDEYSAGEQPLHSN